MKTHFSKRIGSSLCGESDFDTDKGTTDPNLVSCDRCKKLLGGYLEPEKNRWLVEPGIYRHYKGQFYLVIGEVVEHETRKLMVLYVPLYLVDNNQSMTVRDADSFVEKFRRVDP